MAASHLWNNPKRAVRKLSLPWPFGIDFDRFPKKVLEGHGGSLASPWPLDPSGPPWEPPWPGNKQETVESTVDSATIKFHLPANAPTTLDQNNARRCYSICTLHAW